MKGPRIGLLAALVALSLATFWAAAPQAAASAPAPAAAAGVDFDASDCKSCHDKAVTGMKATAHLGLEQSCAACHDGVSAHLKAQTEGAEAPTPSLKKLSAGQLSNKCLTCHDSGHQANWAGGAHDRKDVSCASCHSVHDFKSVKSQLKTARDAETCFTCHQNIRARGLRASHHPVREGLMNCASCHDPHDATRTKMVSADYVNEKCLSCHTEKRGPFLWEHAPVRESCLNCHDAHGSNHEKLLVAKQPYLCQRCHLNTRHPGTLYDATNVTLAASPSNRLIEHSCRNCHQNVHGGNAPSGPYLGR